MRTYLKAVCFFTGIVLLFDVYNVYLKTHKINELINININEVKSNSIVGSYISPLHIKDPFEVVFETVSNIFMIWVMFVGFLLIGFIEIMSFPLYFIRIYH